MLTERGTSGVYIAANALETEMALRCCLSYWLPRLLEAGVPVPRTHWMRINVPLAEVLDQKKPVGFDDFIRDLGKLASDIGFPCFLRTGETSGKHDWDRTCFLPSLDALPAHVVALVEFSEMADFLGLQTDVWVVREMLKTAPLFTAFRGFPVTREFRCFVDDGKLACMHSYWPPGAVEQGRPSDPDWKAKLASANALDIQESHDIRNLVMQAGSRLPGAWSIDVLQDAAGKWWCTDCADAGCSYHWPGCENEKRWERQMFTEDVASP